jgi:hypothetical protein
LPIYDLARLVAYAELIGPLSIQGRLLKAKCFKGPNLHGESKPMDVPPFSAAGQPPDVRYKRRRDSTAGFKTVEWHIERIDGRINNAWLFVD